MSNTTTPKKHSSFHRRNNNSGELDVFDATLYYSGHNELGTSPSLNRSSSNPWRARRMSLDDHIKRTSLTMNILPQGLGKQTSNKTWGSVVNGHAHEEQRHEPRSPGGNKLASFLNSLLFNQSTSKKSKKKSKESEEKFDQRRRRRSSISHVADNNVYSGTKSSVTTPTKSYNDLRSLLDQRLVIKPSHINKPRAISTDDVSMDDKGSGSVGGKSRILLASGSSKLGSKLVDDEGGESDSSSDLFELEIGREKYGSSGLPVYESTHIERIRVGGPPVKFP